MSVNLANKKPTLMDFDLHRLISEKQVTNAELEDRVASTQLAISDRLESEVAVASPFRATDLTGPGLRVELDDAPQDYQPVGDIDPNDLVVHQGDIDAVLNALWAGQAEAISVQGVRIGPTTPVRCIGNVILVGSASFAPPYQIEAIGDPVQLSQSLTQDPQVQIYIRYSEAYGLGWKVVDVEAIQMPALPEGSGTQYAQALGVNDD